MRQVAAGKVKQMPRREMLDLVVGRRHRARHRHPRPGHGRNTNNSPADAVVLCTGGYGNVFYLSTNAKSCNVTAAWRCHKRGAYFANPCFTQIHPTCIPASGHAPVKLTLMSESLRNDGRVWVPKDNSTTRGRRSEIPDRRSRLLPRAALPGFRQPRAPRRRLASGQGTLRRGLRRRSRPATPSISISATRSARDGVDTIRAKYGNLFHMYDKITAEDPYKTPMRIYPAIHYTMGGLWVDYDLESTIPGLFVLGEANFSDHGANRLGASALMQGLADGYFIIPYTMGQHLATRKLPKVGDRSPGLCARRSADAKGRIDRIARSRAAARSTAFTAIWASVMWEHCGMARNEAGLKATIERIRQLREEFWQHVKVPGTGESFNQNLEHAGRVADFLEFAELLAGSTRLHRKESCGGHFREEYQTPEGEAQRDDAELLLRGGLGVPGRRQAGRAAQRAAQF